MNERRWNDLLRAARERDALLARLTELADEKDAEAVARGLRLDRSIPPGDCIRSAIKSAIGEGSK